MFTRLFEGLSSFNIYLKRLFLLPVFIFGFTNCTRSSSTKFLDLKAQNSSHLVPTVPGDFDETGSPTLLAQIKRFRGQSQFLTATNFSEGEARFAAAESSSSNGSGSRLQQESDIYKVGKAGSKLLFLLNNYRGLQVVSFANGEDKPELLGRVSATGNYPQNMYYDQNKDRLIVLENIYASRYSFNSAQNLNSRLVIYNVSNPSHPLVSEIVNIDGRISDSRIVGHVLYVAGSKSDSKSNSDQLKGFISSYDITLNQIQLVDSLSLKLPVVNDELMNIQEIKNPDGSFNYFLVAIMNESGWSWWGRSSLVEVVNITDSMGKISPVMTVSAKGFIRERSQTLIKNSTLIVTSNYTIEENNNTNQSIARIAVETFNLPDSTSEIINEKEASYREIHIDRLLDASKDPINKEKMMVDLISDKTLGLKGRFVRSSEGDLRKVISDSMVTVGDTNGQSSSLQDVRYSNGLLYAFWVPSNNIDPLDIFDITEPEKGVKYLSRLQFDGWISKAVPYTLKGRNFIIGLGWILPSINNENQLRKAQAIIFEIKQKGSKFVAEEVEQMVFSDQQIWIDLNSADKFIEVREDELGRGQILFEASKFEGNAYLSGGKLLNFNLQKIVENKPEPYLTEGPFLEGDSYWLRRVFSNTEINRINTFSDEALRVYDVSKSLPDSTTQAVAVLELARQIQGYESFVKDGKAYGIQIISKTWGYGHEDQSFTKLRLVDGMKPDSEKKTIIQPELKVDGNYNNSLIDGDKLYLLTSKSVLVQSDQENLNYSTVNHLYTIKTSDFSILNTQSWEEHESNSSDHRKWMVRNTRGETPVNLLKLADGRLLVHINDEIHVFSGKSLSEGLVDIKIEGCGVKDHINSTLVQINDHLYYESSLPVEVEVSEKNSSIHAFKNYIAKANLVNNVLKCEANVNIPGQLVTILFEDGVEKSIITDDLWIQDYSIEKPVYQDENGKVVDGTPYVKLEKKSSLIGLELKDGKVILVDELSKETSPFNYRKKSSLSFKPGIIADLFTFKNKSSFRPFGFDRGFINNSYSESEVAFRLVKVDGQGYLTEEKYQSDLLGGEDSYLLGVEAVPGQLGQYFGLIYAPTDSLVQVVKWSDENPRPQIVKLNYTLQDGSLIESQDFMPILGGYLSQYEKVYNFTPNLNSFEINQGLFGINQIYLK